MDWLAHNKKMTEKSVFCEAWSPEMMSQSFPVSCFWSRGFVPHRKWNLTLLVHQNKGKENRYWIFFLLCLSVHWGHLIEQIKKICHIHFKLERTRTINQNQDFLVLFFWYRIRRWAFVHRWPKTLGSGEEIDFIGIIISSSLCMRDAHLPENLRASRLWLLLANMT